MVIVDSGADSPGAHSDEKRDTRDVDERRPFVTPSDRCNNGSSGWRYHGNIGSFRTRIRSGVIVTTAPSSKSSVTAGRLATNNSIC